MPTPSDAPADPDGGSSAPPGGDEPLSPLTDAECRRGMFWAILVSVFNMLAVQCFVDKQLQLYALRLGVEQRTFGTIVFCLAWASVARLPAAARVERRGKKRVLITEWGIACLGAAMVVFAPQLQDWTAEILPAAALTSLHAVNGPAVLFLLIGATAYNLLQQGGGTGWFPLLQDVVPTAVRGRYFGLLRTIWQAATKVFILFAAWFLADAAAGEPPEVWRYQVILGFGLVCAAVRVACIVPIPEVQRPLRPAVPFRVQIMVPLRDRRFRNFILFSGVAYFAWGMFDSFRFVYLTDLKFSERTKQLCVAFGSLGAIAALYHWGRFSDRHGSRPVFGLSLAAIAALALSWGWVSGFAPAEPGGEDWVAITAILGLFFLTGVFESGLGIAQTRQVMELVPRGHQAIYFSLNTVAVMGPMGLGAFLAGAFTQQFEDAAPAWFGWGLDVYQWLFGGAVVVLACALTLNGRAARPEETPTRVVVGRGLSGVWDLMRRGP